jgi:hypothetical protein
MFGTTFVLAIRSIRRHLLRSFLTILGIVIGVAAVVAMVTLGKATTSAVQEQISALGTNVLQIRPGQGFGRGGGGKTFRFERDFPELLGDALAVSRCGASLLLSTNCSSWNDARLEAQARHILPDGTRYECAQIQADHATGSPSSTLWAILP